MRVWDTDVAANVAALETKLNQLRTQGKDIKFVLHDGGQFVIVYLESA